MFADFSRDHIRPQEKLEELPDLAWNRVKGEANEKHSKALLNFADEESKKIANEIARRTVDEKVREAKASATRLEAEARLSQTNEMLARVTLVERCKSMGVLPVWNRSGEMTFLNAPANFDWDGLTQRLLSQDELGQTEEPSTDLDAQGGGPPTP